LFTNKKAYRLRTSFLQNDFFIFLQKNLQVCHLAVIFVPIKRVCEFTPPRSAKRSDHKMTQTTQTVEVLSNPMTIIEAARKGIPRKKVDVLAKAIGLTDREMARILQMSERTFHRYKDDTLLDTNASEKLLLLALLFRKGESIFESLENFKFYVRTPSYLFQNKAPLELLDTNTGFQVVKDALGRLEYGVYI
jgi:putative toxin-antitoxin system antitoxin component (TIGR02293 family)